MSKIKFINKNSKIKMQNSNYKNKSNNKPPSDSSDTFGLLGLAPTLSKTKFFECVGSRKSKKFVFSGIKPTGDLHIGHYIGVIKN